MLINESTIRKLIRAAILKEAFLSSAVTDVGTIIIDIGGKLNPFLVLGKG